MATRREIYYISNIVYLSAWSRQPRALDENLKLGERMFKTLYNLSLTKLDDLYINIYLEKELNTGLGKSRLWCSSPFVLTSGCLQANEGSKSNLNEKMSI